MGWVRVAASMLAGAAVVSASDACAMTAPVSENLKCTVVRPDKLLAETGGAGAARAAVLAALARRAADARVAVAVRVSSGTMLAARLTVEGQELPEQKFGVMDRHLDPGSIEQFAQSIATKVASAAASGIGGVNGGSDSG